jgi:prepilin-type N-terminal cleavage/methylation domain-containing protein
LRRGFTLTEVIIVVSVIGTILAVMTPMFKTTHRAWEVNDRWTEVAQNARIALDKMVREIRQARRIIYVSQKTVALGDLRFDDKTGGAMEFRFNTNTNNLDYGSPSDLAANPNSEDYSLAGPIQSLKFTCYSADGVTETTTPAHIRAVDIEIIVLDEENRVSPLTLISRAYMRGSPFYWPAAFKYAVFTEDPQIYMGGGNPKEAIVNDGDIHSNSSITINTPQHELVEEDEGYVAETHPEYDAITFPDLDLDYYRTLAQSGGDNHYYDSAPKKVVLPESGGVTMIESTSGGAIKISDSTVGQGLLIVIGADIEVSGKTEFHGLIYGKKVNGIGGGFKISGTSDIYGAIYAQDTFFGAGSPRVWYDESVFEGLVTPEGTIGAPGVGGLGSWEEV